MTNDEIRTFIENAIKENRVMLFMKGTPQQPACGFSMRASGALNALGVKYAALDILPDPRDPPGAVRRLRLAHDPRSCSWTASWWAARTS